MPNYVITESTCRAIVNAGTIGCRKNICKRPASDNADIAYLPDIIQVEIVMTGTYTSQNPTWHQEEGWSKRRWAYARVIDEDGEYTGTIITVYSTMSVDQDWTNSDAVGGLTSANQARYACVKINDRWHILSPMELASATLRWQFDEWWNR